MKKLNLELLYAQLDTHRQRWGISWHRLAAQAKISSTVRARMAQGIEPSAKDLAKLRAWLDAWGDRWSCFGLRAIASVTENFYLILRHPFVAFGLSELAQCDWENLGLSDYH